MCPHGTINRRKFVKSVGVAGAGITVAGCLGDDDDGDGETEEFYGIEGEFADSIFGTAWDGWDVPEVAGEFERTTGIDVDIPYIGSDLEGFTSLQGGTEYEFIAPDNIWVQRLAEADLVQPTDEELFDDILDQIPDWLKNEPTMFYEGERYGIPPRWGVSGIIYNSNEVSQEEVQQYSTLWDTAYENRVTLFDVPSFSVQVLVFYLEEQGIIDIGLEDMDRREGAEAIYDAVLDYEEELTDAASDLFDNSRVLAGTTAEMNRPLLEEEVYLASGFLLTYAQLKDIESALGTDFLEFEPTPSYGGLFWIEGMTVTNHAETAATRNAVHAFMRWTLSPQGQARLAWTEARKSAPTNEEAHQHMTDHQRELLFVDQGEEIYNDSYDYIPTNIEDWVEVWEGAK